MATIVEITNPFEPYKDTAVHQHGGGITIAAWLQIRFPGFLEFARPTVCLLDGRPILRAQWPTTIVKADSVVNFVTLPGDLVTLAYYVVAAVVAAGVALALQPKLDGQLAEPDPVYDLRGQRNQNRLGNPIEAPYGKNRLWPSYAAASYNKYIGNQQYQYSLFCLGHGTYTIHAQQIEDTALANFEDVVSEVYEPGDPVTLFPDNVVTSVEVAGIELLGPNEAGYAGESGPFVANPSGTDTTHLEVDVVLPNGLYFANNKGKLVDQAVTALFQYREIDDAGAPVGAGTWTTLASFSKTLRTNTPQRFTLEATVAAARYEVRAVRTNNKNTEARAGNTLRWDALRAFLPSTKDYGNVTLIALKARATNNLNDRAANRFNVVATRKLRTRVASAWTAPVATRSIVWAFADVMQNTEYGGRLTDAFIDIEALEALDTIYTGLGWNFDFVFEQRGTAWEAAKIVGRCGRAVPMLEGSRVTLIRDFVKTVPTSAFNQENIVQGSFSHDVRLATIDEFDGLEVEYVDPDTFKPETVLCLVDGEAGDYPESVKLPGVMNRTQAYREGLYLRASKLKLRESITFRTGLEGHIPSYLDLIRVVHDTPKWGQGGLVLSISGTTVTLNEPVTFGGGTHKIAFRTKNGGFLGPYTVTAGSAANIVEMAAPLPDLDDFFFDTIHERPLFLFGAENLNGILCVVSGLTPGTDDTVEVKAFVQQDLFAGDASTPPALPADSTPSTPPDLPEIDCTLVSYIPLWDDPTKGRLTWPATDGANYFNVQSSSDGTNWIDVGQTSELYMEVDVEEGEALYLRVQAVGAGSGPWCSPPTGTPGDGGGEPPPGEPKKYHDLITHLPTISASLDCREKSATGTLIGYSEFTSASTPPKKYLNKALAGTLTGHITNNADCTGPVCTGTRGFSGVCSYDPVTGVLTQGGLLEGATSFTDCANLGSPDTVCTVGDGNTEVLTQTTREETYTNACCSGASCEHNLAPDRYRHYEGVATETLSNEDTEENAIARLLAAASWTSWASSSLAACNSSWAIRTGFTFAYIQAQGRINVTTGLSALTSYLIRVTISRTDLDTMETEESQVLEFLVETDGSGDIAYEFDIPAERGFSTFISAINFYAF